MFSTCMSCTALKTPITTPPPHQSVICTCINPTSGLTDFCLILAHVLSLLYITSKISFALNNIMLYNTMQILTQKKILIRASSPAHQKLFQRKY